MSLQMLEQTFLCHEGCEKLAILLYVTSIHKFLHKIIQLKDANHLQIPLKPFGGSINVIHVLQQW